MSHELDLRTGRDDDRTCRQTLRPLHDTEEPAFGRYIGLINGRR